MKKTIVTLIALTMLTVSSVFAAGSNDINKNALTTFSTSFAKATNVKWEKKETYYKASFEMNGQSLNALLSETGDIIAVSRNILSTDLPLSLQYSLNKNFSSFWISELTEFALGGETVYYIVIENADTKTTLKSVDTSDWSEVKKIAK